MIESLVSLSASGKDPGGGGGPAGNHLDGDFPWEELS